jgi:tripartite-type tricarboxylate transporter receptor subunit TctC
MIAAMSAFLALVGPGDLAASADYPSKPVRIVVGYPAGGGTDIVARILAEELSKRLGQQFFVENRPGASGQIGADEIAKANPDGYNLFMTASPEMAIARALGKKLPYDPGRDFHPISLVTRVPFILVVHPSVQAKSVHELIDLAKKKPGDLNFASFGAGTSNHLVGELFKSTAGIDVVHVPYKGSAPAITDLLGGHVDMTFDALAVALPYVESGKLRGLAVATSQRSPLAPNIPTIAEAGLGEFEGGTWYGLVAPKDTPKEITTKLAEMVKEIVTSSEAKAKLEKRGLVPVGSTPEEFQTFVQSEIKRWSDVARKAGLVE